MKTITPRKITLEDFARYGEYYVISEEFSEEEKNSPETFILHKDVYTQKMGQAAVGYFNTYFLERDPVFHEMEKHDIGEESLLAIDSMVLVVAPPSDGPPLAETFEAFIVPANTFIKYKVGVWHYAPCPVDTRYTRTLYYMPPYTFAYDDTMLEVPEKVRVEM